jgi:DNA-binding SARP family transcriptional activator
MKDNGVVNSTGLGFGVLGPLEMTVGGTPVPVGAAKQRAVLAMLLLNRNRAVSSDALIQAAWEDSPPTEARASLHAYVSNLRRLINDAGFDGRTVLAAAPPGYRLSVADIDCDIGRFIMEKTAGVRAAAAGNFEEASRHLSAALAEWRGQILEDLRDFQFVASFGAAILEDRVGAHIARAEVEIACGRGDAVIGELEALTAQHPYREPLWAQLITAYYVGGRQSDALDAYRRLKTTLVEDLGIDPGPKLRALHEKVLRQEPLDTARTARATAAATVITLNQRKEATAESTVACLRARSGRTYPLSVATTRVGRLADNDIVLDDIDVSRHHAVISDTGTSYVITDLRSANGVFVRGQRIRGSVVLADGDPVRISTHELVFEIRPD